MHWCERCQYFEACWWIPLTGEGLCHNCRSGLVGRADRAGQDVLDLNREPASRAEQLEMRDKLWRLPRAASEYQP